MNTVLLPTPRKGILHSYHFNNGCARVRLYDIHGVAIPKTDTSYKMKHGETEEQAHNFALSSALDRLDKQAEAVNPELKNKNHYFTSYWSGLSEAEQKRCAGEGSSAALKDISSITYFQRNILPRLDEYGASITPQQCQMIADELLCDTFRRKKFTSILVPKEEAKSITPFFTALGKKLEERFPKAGKPLSGDLAKLKDMVLEEDRLRSYLERYLRRTNLMQAAQTLSSKMKKSDLSRLLLPQPVEPRLILLLRFLACNEADTKRQVNSKLLACNRILQGMCLFCGEDFPNIQLPLYADALNYQPEQQKTLETSQRLAFAARMMEQSATSNYAAGALIMLTTGPRTEEACAMTFGRVLHRGSYGVYTLQETNRKRIISQEGKNQNFARNIFLLPFVLTALKRRMEHLLSLGYTQAQVDAAYIVCDPDDPMAPIHPARFSSAVRADLTLCGCDRNLWSDVENQQLASMPDMDPVAYLLRRDAISTMVNYSSMDPLLVDALVGHVLPANAPDWSTYIRDEDKWDEIVEQMERFVYIPAYSTHPSLHPICLGTDKSRTQLLSQEIALEVKEGMTYRITYEVHRGTEFVQALLPHGADFAFEAQPSVSPPEDFLILPLFPQKAYQRAQELAVAPAAPPRPHPSSSQVSAEKCADKVTTSLDTPAPTPSPPPHQTKK